MERWVTEFPKQMGVLPVQCMGYANHHSGTLSKTKPRMFYLKVLAKALASVITVDCAVDQAPSVIVPFEKYFNNLIKVLQEKQEKEENNLIKM